MIEISEAIQEKCLAFSDLRPFDPSTSSGTAGSGDALRPFDKLRDRGPFDRLRGRRGGERP